jgi:hypothetical protein
MIVKIVENRAIEIVSVEIVGIEMRGIPGCADMIAFDVRPVRSCIADAEGKPSDR